MTRHLHVLGICGYATSGLAMMAREMGDVVTGSDDHAYPPLSDTVTAAGIPWAQPSDPKNLDRWGVPDLVVVGNQTRAHNPEWLAVQERGIPAVSEIEFFALAARDRLHLTVCGTHGKTTTSALLAHMLDRARCDPGFRLGSQSLDFDNRSARLGTGPFVFEGDEYTTAPWDPRAKFLLTHAEAACVTRLELDHPDVYPTLESYRRPFIELASALPAGGLLALCADDPEALALREHARSHVTTYGRAATADWRITGVRADAVMQRFRVERRSESAFDVALTFPGEHNAANACAALILAVFAGAPLSTAVDACATFRGPARRFQVVGEVGGITVVDDYAHHPTEVRAAIAAARQRYGDRRLIAIHTPHTFSRTRTLLEEYRHSFEQADVVMIGPIEAARERGSEATVSSRDVADRVGPTREVVVVTGSDEAVESVRSMACPGDVVLVLSLGGFDKLAPRIAGALEGVRAGG